MMTKFLKITNLKLGAQSDFDDVSKIEKIFHHFLPKYMYGFYVFPIIYEISSFIRLHVWFKLVIAYATKEKQGRQIRFSWKEKFEKRKTFFFHLLLHLLTFCHSHFMLLRFHIILTLMLLEI